MKIIRIAVEENNMGIMIHLVDMPGAFTRAPELSLLFIKNLYYRD